MIEEHADSIPMCGSLESTFFLPALRTSMYSPPPPSRQFGGAREPGDRPVSPEPGEIPVGKAIGGEVSRGRLVLPKLEERHGSSLKAGGAAGAGDAPGNTPRQCPPDLFDTTQKWRARKEELNALRTEKQNKRQWQREQDRLQRDRARREYFEASQANELRRREMHRRKMTTDQELREQTAARRLRRTRTRELAGGWRSRTATMQTHALSRAVADVQMRLGDDFLPGSNASEADGSPYASDGSPCLT